MINSIGGTYNINQRNINSYQQNSKNPQINNIQPNLYKGEIQVGQEASSINQEQLATPFAVP